MPVTAVSVDILSDPGALRAIREAEAELDRGELTSGSWPPCPAVVLAAPPGKPLGRELARYFWARRGTFRVIYRPVDGGKVDGVVRIEVERASRRHTCRAERVVPHMAS